MSSDETTDLTLNLLALGPLALCKFQALPLVSSTCSCLNVPNNVNLKFSSHTSEADPHHNGQSPVSSLCEDSDTSEFEHIEVDMIPSLAEIENQAIHNAEDEEENKMDVAGARPIAQMVRAYTYTVLVLDLLHCIREECKIKVQTERL